MKIAELSLLPDWPEILDKETAPLFLGGRPTLLKALVERGYLTPFSERRKACLYLREDVITALKIAKAKGDDLAPMDNGGAEEEGA